MDNQNTKMTLQEEHKLLPLFLAMHSHCCFLRRKVKPIFDNKAGKDFKKSLTLSSSSHFTGKP